MEGRNSKKTKVTKSKTKRPVKKTTTQSKPSTTPKRQSVTRTRTTKKATPQRKVSKATNRSKVAAPVVDSITQLHPSRVSGLVRPLSVQTVSPLRTTLKSSASVHPWSLRHHFVVVLTLTIVGLMAMVAIAVFTQVTIQNIESLSGTTDLVFRPSATETRFYPTMAGELAITLPTAWDATEVSDNKVTYSHTTVANAKITVEVNTNETDDVATWLEAQTPTYTDDTVVASNEAASAWRGMTVTATSETGTPLTILYLPIQKNLGERYIVTVTAEHPTTDYTGIIDSALEELVGGLDVK